MRCRAVGSYAVINVTISQNVSASGFVAYYSCPYYQDIEDRFKTPYELLNLSVPKC